MLTKRILTEINTGPQKTRDLWKFTALGASVFVLAVLLLFSYTLALAILLVGAVCVWIAYKRDHTGRTPSLVYDNLDTETGARFAAMQEACEALASSERIWRIAEQRNPPNKPGIRAASASDRQPVKVGYMNTPGISTNVAIWGIDADDIKVFFFPEAVLLYKGGQYKALSYESVEVDLSCTRYAEIDKVPEDAEVVGKTWRYTRENGSRDQRYATNPQIPIVLYGLLRITSLSGLDISLQVSDRAAATRFAYAFGTEEREKTDERERPHEEESPREETSGSKKQERANHSTERKKAKPLECEILGVTEDASLREITVAYRSLAQIYHPDKVENLTPEVREFADLKMKEINAAYAELKRRSKQRPPVSTETRQTSGSERGASEE
jgi:hypothetical protein